ncbi:hypothetical protein [Thalassotalea hakodatensis]|uniref:hypothetical protein n=1 Tax=Thalassotalea hakodatensis TaxID=3030492 RepID=UPI0025747BEE|nr:hypothetical protein [Thalassotalea hakodatensis]
MKILNDYQVKQVNGGVFISAIIVIGGSYLGGYIYGRLTRPTPPPKPIEPCSPNPTTGKQCA